MHGKNTLSDWLIFKDKSHFILFRVQRVTFKKVFCQSLGGRKSVLVTLRKECKTTILHSDSEYYLLPTTICTLPVKHGRQILNKFSLECQDTHISNLWTDHHGIVVIFLLVDDPISNPSGTSEV